MKYVGRAAIHWITFTAKWPLCSHTALKKGHFCTALHSTAYIQNCTFHHQCTLRSTCKAGCSTVRFSPVCSSVEGNSMPGIAAWWCKGAWEKAAALAKIPDSTGAGPCEGASDDPEKDHHHGGATDYSSSGDSKMIYQFHEGLHIFKTS